METVVVFFLFAILIGYLELRHRYKGRVDTNSVFTYEIRVPNDDSVQVKEILCVGCEKTGTWFRSCRIKQVIPSGTRDEKYCPDCFAEMIINASKNLSAPDNDHWIEARNKDIIISFAGDNKPVDFPRSFV